MFGRFSTEVRFRFPNKRATWRITCCRVSRSRAHAPAGWRLIGSMRSSSPSCLRPESEPNYCMIYFGRWLPLCRRVGPGGALIPFTIHPLHCSLHVTPPHRPPTASPIALAYLQPSLSLFPSSAHISVRKNIFFWLGRYTREWGTSRGTLSTTTNRLNFHTYRPILYDIFSVNTAI